MSKTVRAIHEGGVFRPVEHLELPERCFVEFEPRPSDPPDVAANLDASDDLRSRRHRSGRHDLA